MYWSTLNFGEYAHKMTLPEVLLHDPSWFFWAIDNDVLEKRPQFRREARDLNFKARNIKIPRPDSEHWRVRYTFEHYNELFSGFQFVQVPSAAEANPDRLDLSVPHRRTRYVKAGNEPLLRDFKINYFRGQKEKSTTRQCEKFFDNAAKFFEPPELACTRSNLRNFLPA